MQEKEPSVEEIDKILSDLESSIDASPPGEGVKVFEIRDRKELPPAEGSLLRFECPSAIWEEFTEYCKRNELDPAQQIREAIIGYYKNLWQTYRIRRRLNDDSKLV